MVSICRIVKSSFTVLLLVGNTHLLLINGGSVKRWWVSKSFTDVTYNDSHRGLVKFFSDRGLVKLFLPTYHQLLIINHGVVYITILLVFG
jgi:hypothetical protein